MYAPFIAIIIISIIILVVAVSLAEPLTSFRGISSASSSFSYKDWEDPVYSNFHATRLVGGGLPDECSASTVGPDILRVDNTHSDFLRSRGIKMKSCKSTNLRPEGFNCGELAETAAATFAIEKAPPAIYTHGSQILQVNKALEEKIWDPTLRNGTYSYKV
jgi:hypothetical protein